MSNPVIETKPKRVHVIPLDDEAMHSAQMKCWCHPIEVAFGVVTHHAKDCREAKERAGVVTHKGWVNISEF